MPYASDFGFFLNKQRFIAYCTQKFATNAHHAPSDPLLSAVFLWANRLAQDERWPIVEEAYVSHCAALINAAPVTGLLNPLYIIQAQLLLANFYFYCARFIDARNHLAAAVALTISNRLSKIRGQLKTPADSKMYLVDIDANAPLENLVDEGERIHAFWTVYTVDKLWAMALDRQAFFADDGSPLSTIETPWPLAMEEFEKVKLIHQ